VKRARISALLLAAAVAAPVLSAQVSTTDGGPRVHLRQRTWIDLKITPLNGTPAEGSSPGPVLLKVDPSDGVETEFALAWPDPSSKSGLKLRAAQAAPASGMDHAVDLDAELTLPSGRKVLAERRIELDSRTTVLFEIHRHAERPLTLVIEAEASEETIISRHPVVGAPVRFLLEVQRVEQGRTISLETNQLQAFEGQAVSYSFRLGDNPDAEAARVSLRPLRVSGSIVEIEVETDGKLPDGDRLLVIGRRERLVASRGTISTLAFESGDPPTGYRFLVTADF
jgi:hypothetical protein